MDKTRRKIIKNVGLGTLGLHLLGGLTPLTQACSGGGSEHEEADAETASPPTEAASLFFQISLAQWSLNRSIFGKSREMSWQDFRKTMQSNPDDLLQGEIDPLDFPVVAKRDFGIDALELVNTFYFSRSQDNAYWQEFKNRCDQEGVKVLLIMCDAEGNLGDADEQKRIQAVENHYKWVDAAKFLGCHSIRVNAAGQGTAEEVKAAAVDGLGRLTAYGASNDINIIVENHGGYSSDGQWLSAVLSQVNSEYCGSLPDFGNFCIEWGEEGCTNEYDRYRGVKELMPFAKGVSAKSNAFDAQGNETGTDYNRMLKIVKEAGFKGYIGIEYEGKELAEPEGIKATKALLERAGRSLGV